MKKSLFLFMAVFILMLSGCKTHTDPVTPAEETEVFSIDKINFDCTYDENDYPDREPFVVYKQISIGTTHYFFCIQDGRTVDVKYDKKTLFHSSNSWLDQKALCNNYLNGKLDITDPETFSEYCPMLFDHSPTLDNNFRTEEILGNTVTFIILPYVSLFIDQSKIEVPEDIIDLKVKNDDSFISIYGDELGDYIDYYLDQSTLKGYYRSEESSDENGETIQLIKKDVTDLTNSSNIVLDLNDYGHFQSWFLYYYSSSRNYGIDYDSFFSFHPYFWAYNKNVINTFKEITGQEYDTLYDYNDIDNLNFKFYGSIDSFKPVLEATAAMIVDDETDEVSYIYYKKPVIKFNVKNIVLYDATDANGTDIQFDSDDFKEYNQFGYATSDLPQLYIAMDYLKFSPYENKILNIGYDNIGYNF